MPIATTKKRKLQDVVNDDDDDYDHDDDEMLREEEEETDEEDVDDEEDDEDEEDEFQDAVADEEDFQDDAHEEDEYQQGNNGEDYQEDNEDDDEGEDDPDGEEDEEDSIHEGNEDYGKNIKEERKSEAENYGKDDKTKQLEDDDDDENTKSETDTKQGSEKLEKFAPGLPPIQENEVHKPSASTTKKKQETPIKIYKHHSDIFNDDDEDIENEEDLEEEKERFYAVRHGLNVQACIFLYWEDCWNQIQRQPGDYNTKIEYEAFEELEDAIHYVRIGKQLRAEGENEKHKNGKGKGGGGSKKPKPKKPGAVDGYQKWADKWESMYQELVQYKEEHGDCLVQTGRDQKPELKELGRWVARQRKNYKDYINNIGQPRREELRIKHREIWGKRFKKLENIGFSFNARKTLSEQRQKEFIEEKGIELDKIDDKKLKRMMRREYNIKRRKKEDRKYASWAERFEELQEYKRKYGTIDVDSDWETPNGGGCRSTLGRWVQVQRRNIKLYRQGDVALANIDEDRIKQLIDIGLDVRAGKRHKYRRRADAEKIEESWDEYYKELREYFDTNGTSNVRAKPYTPLRGWVVKQRREYELLKAGKPSDLTAERMAKLSEVKFTFSTQKTLYTFEERLNQLKKYQEDHGHIVVPRFAKGYGQGLGKWVQQQRVKYKLNLKGTYTTLTAERQQALEEMGMVWSILKPAQHRAERMPWDVRYEQFLEFKKEHGHTVVPQHYPELGNWVNQQRVHYKLMKQGRESLMTPEKALKLADAGFVFHVKGRKSNKNEETDYQHSTTTTGGGEPQQPKKKRAKKSRPTPPSIAPAPSPELPPPSPTEESPSSTSKKAVSAGGLVAGLPHHTLVVPQLPPPTATAKQDQKLSAALKEELQHAAALTSPYQHHAAAAALQQQQLSHLHSASHQQQFHHSLQTAASHAASFPFATSAATAASAALAGAGGGDHGASGSGVGNGPAGWLDSAAASALGGGGSSSQHQTTGGDPSTAQNHHGHLTVAQFDPIEFSRMNGAP